MHCTPECEHICRGLWRHCHFNGFLEKKRLEKWIWAHGSKEKAQEQQLGSPAWYQFQRRSETDSENIGTSRRNHRVREAFGICPWKKHPSQASEQSLRVARVQGRLVTGDQGHLVLGDVWGVRGRQGSQIHPLSRWR